MASLREIAVIMDSVEPAMDLRTLLNMHRFAPSDAQSLRTICNRHDHPEKKTRRFLFLNTYLMQVYVGNKPVRKFLRGFFFTAMGGLNELFGTPFNIVEDLAKSKKPAVEDRARKIGELIKEYYPIALLCEVFENNVKDKILEAWGTTDSYYIQSESQPRTDQSSGLVTISQEDSLSPKISHEFDNEAGSDALADKAVMLTTLDIGFGSSRVELFSTHINTGNSVQKRIQIAELVTFIDRNHADGNLAILAGDFNIGEFIDNNDETSDRFMLPFSQGGGLSGGGAGSDSVNYDSVDRRFINRINNLISGAVLPMIPERNYAEGMTLYEILSELMTWIGFKDIWKIRNGNPGYTSNMDNLVTAELICREDSNYLDPPFCYDRVIAPTDVLFNDDEGNLKSNRIDYVFMSNANDSHTFNLDFDRPRRTRMERLPGAPELEKIGFLSDHLGLTTNLIISPK